MSEKLESELKTRLRAHNTRGGIYEIHPTDLRAIIAGSWSLLDPARLQGIPGIGPVDERESSWEVRRGSEAIGYVHHTADAKPGEAELEIRVLDPLVWFSATIDRPGRYERACGEQHGISFDLWRKEG